MTRQSLRAFWGEWDCSRRAKATLVDATAFAYLCMAIEVFLYILATNILIQPSYLRTPHEYLWVGLSLSGIFWLVGFTIFLFPLPTIGIALYLAFRYASSVEFQAEHSLIPSWYFFSVGANLVFRWLYRAKPQLSIGTRLFGLPVRNVQSHDLSSKTNFFKRVLATLVISDWIELPWPTSVKATSQHGLKQSRITGCITCLILFAMVLGIASGVLWRVPLTIGAKEAEDMAAVTNNSVYARLPIAWWLYAGNSNKALTLAEAQIKQELVNTSATSMDKIVTTLFWVDVADRAGYCSSERWNQLSQKLTVFIEARIKNGLIKPERSFTAGAVKYLQDGNVRHGLYSEAERMDKLQLESALAEYGRESSDYLHSLYTSAMFHLRIKQYAKALKQFELIVKTTSSKGRAGGVSTEAKKAQEQIDVLSLTVNHDS